MTRTPVIAGVCATDPFRNMVAFLKQLKELGFAGVQNFPTVGLIDGQFRDNLEETGMSFDKEVDMIRLAHEQDMLTTPYVFNVEESRKMAQAGADVLVCHMGLTVCCAKSLRRRVRGEQILTPGIRPADPLGPRAERAWMIASSSSRSSEMRLWTSSRM